MSLVEAKSETRERLLDAAEDLFAERGFDAASLRDITKEAGANVAAVNYHFGGKEQLISAVMMRHAVPVNEERMRRLGILLERKKKPTVREVLEAFMGPLVERIQEREVRQRLFARFLGRMSGEGVDCLPEDALPGFRAMAKRVVEALQAASPGLSEAKAYLQIKLSFAVMADAMMRDEMFARISDGKVKGMDWGRLYLTVLDFCEGGFRQLAKSMVVMLSVGLALTMGGCGRGSSPASRMGEVAREVPGSWLASREGSAGVDHAWIRRFGDTRLIALSNEAVAANPSMRVAEERVSKAVLMAKGARAEALPQASVGLSGQRNKQVFVGLPIPGRRGPLSSLSSNFGASLNVSWEPDIWGKVAAANSAELARLDAEAQAYRAARASLVGQVAKAWFALGEANEQVALAAASLELRKKTEEAVTERFSQALAEDGGTASQVRLTRTDVANARESLVRWQGEAERAARQIELLTGRYPSGQVGQGGVSLPKLPSKPPVGLPSELLMRRPDVLEAERRFAAGLKDSEVADLARFPSFSLTSGGGRTTSELADLLDSDFGVWNVAGNLTAPILSGRRLETNYEISRSNVRSEVAKLQRAVLDAFGEVEQALVADRVFDERIGAAQRAYDEAKEANRSAAEGYAEGVDSVLTLLQANGQELQLGSQVIALRRLRLENRVNLHLALGGDFDVRGK